MEEHNSLRPIDRMYATLYHEEPDKVADGWDGARSVCWLSESFRSEVIIERPGFRIFKSPLTLFILRYAAESGRAGAIGTGISQSRRLLGGRKIWNASSSLRSTIRNLKKLGKGRRIFMRRATSSTWFTAAHFSVPSITLED